MNTITEPTTDIAIATDPNTRGVATTEAAEVQWLQPELPIDLPTPVPDLSLGEVVARLDRIAELRQLRRVDRDESLEFVGYLFASFDEHDRRAIAEHSQSLLHVLEVFVLDPAPSVRVACAFNPNSFDVRIQRRLAADPNPFVVLGFLDAVDPALEVAEWLIEHSPFDTVRWALTQRRLSTDLLRRLCDDPSDFVASAARVRLTATRPALRAA